MLNVEQVFPNLLLDILLAFRLKVEVVGLAKNWVLLRVFAVLLNVVDVQTLLAEDRERQVRATNCCLLLLNPLVCHNFDQRILDRHLAFVIRTPE